MEFNGCMNYEQETLMGELNQGLQLAKQLKAQMSAELSGGETKGMLAERLSSCFEKALSILKWESESMKQSHQNMGPSNIMPESPISVMGSPRSENLNPGCCVPQESRKRKMLPTWTVQVNANFEKTVEGTPEDGYNWRKYGQKDILGAKFPRSYYRCTYRNIQGCNATKQVQQNDEDPLIFDITYKGHHTCTTVAPTRSKSDPTSPQKQQINQNNNFSISQYHPDMLRNFQKDLKVDIPNLQDQDMGFSFGSGYETGTTITPSILHESQAHNGLTLLKTPSPATLESAYFSPSPCHISSFGEVLFGQNSECNVNSPIFGIDLPLNQWEFNTNSFSYDNQACPNNFSQAKE